MFTVSVFKTWVYLNNILNVSVCSRWGLDIDCVCVYIHSWSLSGSEQFALRYADGPQLYITEQVNFFPCYITRKHVAVKIILFSCGDFTCCILLCSRVAVKWRMEPFFDWPYLRWDISNHLYCLSCFRFIKNILNNNKCFHRYKYSINAFTKVPV